MQEPTALPAIDVDYYPRDGSVFLDTHYLIKGVAGALFWKLAREHQRNGRSEFSLRELRLAGHELRLPEVQDNLSARMLLLQRRLTAREAPLHIEKIGRGRIRVQLLRPLRLNERVFPERVTTPSRDPIADVQQVGARFGFEATPANQPCE